MIRRHIVFSGRVQGVGFRYRAAKAAEMYGCTGWVRNDRNGTVSMEIQGTEEQMDRVIRAIENGRFIRIDNIRRVKAGPVEKHPEQYEGTYERLRKHLWGVSLRNQQALDHVEMTVRAGAGEAFIQDRLEREKRCGMVERIDDTRLRFTADVFDAGEMLPWIRTFIGRIESLECSNQAVSRRFYEDFETMEKMYGGDGDAVQ